MFFRERRLLLLVSGGGLLGLLFPGKGLVVLVVERRGWGRTTNAAAAMPRPMYITDAILRIELEEQSATGPVFTQILKLNLWLPLSVIVPSTIFEALGP